MPEARGDGTDLDRILARAKRHDPGALAELYGRFGRQVFGLACYLLPTREAAEDATSEVFLRIHRTLAAFDGRIPFDKWLLRVTGNWCIDWLRRRRFERRLFRDEPPDEHDSTACDTPLDDLLVREREEVIRDAIRHLPERYRVPLVLRYYAGLTYDEIAGQLGTDRPQTGVLLFRAKRELRRILEGGYR